MKNKLFVGGLAWATTEASLRSAAQAYGDVEDVKVITDRDTGRSKGFGFVTFATDEAAAKCKSEMDGQVIDGRPVKVDYPREREDRGGDRGGFGHGGGRSGGGFGRGPRGY
ncbi:MAG: RNA-binding protein [Deltaproteobacteria bacterium]|nr:RNA-binding protein [Deltaproteobacteria bacterium]